MKRLGRVRALFGFLREKRHLLFDDALQGQLEEMYRVLSARVREERPPGVVDARGREARAAESGASSSGRPRLRWAGRASRERRRAEVRRYAAGLRASRWRVAS
jgi:hypothetical protein